MVCNKCGVDKPLSEFYADKKRKHGVCTVCKECTIKQVQERYWQKRDEILEYHKHHYIGYRRRQKELGKEYYDMVQSLKTPCAKCGESRLYVLDFHHIDPKDKSFNINRKTSKSDFSVIENEVKKCICLCRNCHMEYHFFFGQNPDDPQGTLAEYLDERWSPNGR
jgi:hypothetical protein